MRNKFLIFVALQILLSAHTFAQSGGAFEITQSVVANSGGQNSAGGAFAVDGTIGQSVRQTNPSSGDIFSLQSGFWLSNLAPTTASVSISGKVLQNGGGGIYNASVILTDMNGNTRSAKSNSFGFYRFNEVPAGATYIVSVRHKQFSFAPQVILVVEDLTELNFTAQPY